MKLFLILWMWLMGDVPTEALPPQGELRATPHETMIRGSVPAGPSTVDSGKYGRERNIQQLIILEDTHFRRY